MKQLLFRLAISLLPVACASGQSAEEQVGTALDHLVALARAANEEALASRLACYSGVSGAGALHLRPCVLPADQARTTSVLQHLRSTFGVDTVYVIDWLTSSSEDGFSGYRIQVKVRRKEPPDLVEYLFLAYGEELLLADAGSMRQDTPDLPDPASPREAAERAMESLFHLAQLGKGAEAALLSCPEGETATIRSCRYEDPDDRARVDQMLVRLQRFLQRVGPTGWAFTDYRSENNQQSTRHIVEIGYLDQNAPEGKNMAGAVFIPIGGSMLLVELVGWPE